MILIIITTFLILYFIFAIVFFVGLMKIPVSKPISSNYPTVSILVSCRNEAKDLPECLQSIQNLDYPKEKIQVVLVDDFSTDNTPEILADSAAQFDNFEFYQSVNHEETHLKAKARGIHIASTYATGEWMFITDADCRLPASWIKHMLHGTDEKTGIITGTMETLNPSFVGTLEKIVGFFKLLIAFGIAGFGAQYFALGPNMAIRRKVYEESGGLLKADFKIAEDLALFRLSDNLGYTTKYHYDHFTLVKLTPVDSLKQMISQQRRWISGGFEGSESSSAEKTIIRISFIFCPLLAALYIYLCFAYPIYGLELTALKMASEFIMFLGVKIRHKSPGILRLLPLVQFYTIVTYIWLPLSFVFSKSTKWLGDGYEIKYD